MRTQIIDKSVVVSAIEGNVEIVLADGSSRPLQKGEILQPGAKLAIADDAKLALSPYDDTPASDVPAGSESDGPAQPQVAASQEGAPSDIAALQESILQGVDPTQNFEASAAGGAPAAGGGGGIGGVAGASGNGGFVTIDRTGDATIAAAGFDTTYDTAAVINENQAEDLILENQLDDLGETAVTLEDTQVSGNLLDNSTNPDGPADASIVSYDWGVNIGVPAGVAATITGVGTLIINPDGSYTFTPAPNYDGAVPPVSYQVTDGQDTVTSTLVISITPVDEEVSLDGLTQEGGEVLVSDANLADGSAPNAAALTQSGVFTFNAPDGVQSLALGNVTLITNGQSATSFPLSIISPLGNVLTITAVTYNPVTGAGQVSYSYTLGDNENHTRPAIDTSLSESFSVVLTDSDGDTASDTLDITILDDIPTLAGDIGSTLGGQVQEDALTSGNNEGTGQSTSASGAAGTLNNLVNFGADGAGSFGLGSDVSSLTAQGLTSGGVALSYSVVGNVLTASAGGVPVFTLTVGVDGSYSFTLSGPLDHPVADGDDSEQLAGVGIDFSGVLTATDGDGDPLTGGFPAGSFAIKVEDDVPTLTISDPDGASLDGTTAVVETAANISGGWDLVKGADGVMSVTVSVDGQASQALSLADAANTVTFNTASGTLTVKADGSWTFDPKPVDNDTDPADVVNFSISGTDADGDPFSDTQTINVLDGPGPGNGNAVTLDLDEDDLLAGSGTPKGPLTDSATVTFVAGSDPFAGFAFQGTSGITVNVNGTTGDDLFWTLDSGVLNAHLGSSSGTIVLTVSLVSANPAAGTVGVSAELKGALPHATANGENTITITGITVVASDVDGDSATAAVTVNIVDDMPTLTISDPDGASLDGTTAVVETAANISGGWDLVKGADGVMSVTVSVDGQASQALSLADAANTVTFNTASGTLTVKADGSWTFDPKPVDNDTDPADVVNFSISGTDADGDPFSDTQTINVLDGTGPGNGNAVTLDLDEDDLLAGSGTPKGPLTDSATVTFVAGSDPFAGFAFQGTSGTSGITVNVNGTTGDDLFWTLDSGVLNAHLGSSSGTIVLTVSLVSANPAAGTVGVSAELKGALPHATANGENTITITGITVVASDVDGDSATAAVTVNVVDDMPTLTISDPDGASLDGTTAVVETAANISGGWDLVKGADGVMSVTVSVDGQASQALSLADAANTVTFNTASGTLTVKADGSWTFDPKPVDNDTDPADVVNFSISGTDADGDPFSDTQTINVLDGTGPGNGTGVTLDLDEDDLLAGSGTPKGPLTDSATVTFVAGSDPFTGFAFQGTSGITVNVNGTTGDDLFWTLDSGVLNAHLGSSSGTIVLTVSLVSANPAAGTVGVSAELKGALPHATANGENTITITGITVVASDVDGDSATAAVTVNIVDDMPTLTISDPDGASLDGTTAVVETAANISGGWDLVKGADGVMSVTVSVDGQASQALSLADAANTVTFNTASGTLTVKADGSWTFDPKPVDNDTDPADVVNFSISGTDADGDPFSDTQTINVLDGPGPGNGNAVTLDLDEDDLLAGSGTPKGPLTDSATVTFVAGSDPFAGFAFQGTSGITVNVNGTTGDDLFWTLDSGVLNAHLGSSSGTIVLTVSLVSANPAAGTVGVSAELKGALPHATANGENTITITGITVVASDVDGDSATAAVTVNIVDDMPTLTISDPDGASLDGTTAVVETAANISGGWDLVKGADGVMSVTVSVDGQASQALSLADAANTVTFNTASGTLTVKADGSWTFDPKPVDNDTDPADVVNFSISGTDADGDPFSDTQTINVLDGTGPGNGNAVTLDLDEDDLLAGSGTPKGPLTDSATVTFVAGSDPFAGFAFQGTSGITVNVNGTTGDDLFWTLDSGVLNAHLGSSSGTIVLTVSLVSANPAAGTVGVSAELKGALPHATANGENTITITGITVVASDVDGDSATAAVTVNVVDDMPTLTISDPDGASLDGTTAVVETAANISGGWDLVKGADGVMSVTVSVDGQASQALSLADAANTVTFNTASGTLTVKADGSWTFDPKPVDNDTDPADVVNFSISGTDADGDPFSDTQTINVLDGPGPGNGNAVTLDLDEDDLLAGSGTPKGPLTDSATVTFVAGSDPFAGFAFQGTSGITVNVNGTTGDDLFWTLDSGVLNAHLGSSSGTIVLTVSLVSANPAAGTVGVSAELKGALPHATANGENTITITGITVVASDVDGDSATAAVTVNIVDDMPTLTISDPDGASLDGTTAVVETAANISGGWDLVKGADGVMSVTVSVDGQASQALSLADAANTVTFNTASGTLTVKADGSWTFDPKPVDNDTDPADVVNFSISGTDADGDPFSDTQTINVLDGTGPGNGTGVTLDLDEDDLLAGSGTPKGPLTDSATVTFVAGSDPFAGFAFQGTSGITVNVNGTTGDDLFWTLDSGVLNAHLGSSSGTIVLTVSLVSANPAAGTVGVSAELKGALPHATANGENTITITGITVVASDVDGDSATAAVTVNVVDDMPTLTISDPDGASLDGTTAVVETAANISGGWDLVKGADGVMSVTVSVDGQASQALSLADSANTVTFNTASGTLTVKADGSWTFDPKPVDNDTDPADVVNFSISGTDADGDPFSDTQTINVLDGPGPGNGNAVTLDLDEDDLLAGSGTPKGPLTDSATVTFVAGSDPFAGFAFQGTSGITVNVNGTTGDDLFWTLDSGVLNAHLGSSSGTIVLTVSLVSANPAAGTVGVSAELKGALPHATANGENTITITGITVVASDVDGDSATAAVTVNVVDDVPSIGIVQPALNVTNVAGTVFTGTFDLTSGADQPVTASLLGNTVPAGLSSGGQLVSYYVDPNNPGVLVAYTGIDPTASGAKVFALTIIPGSDQYKVEVFKPLDGITSTVAIDGSSSFGSGPQPWQVLSNSTVGQLSVLTGWKTTGAFNLGTWKAGGAAAVTFDNVNGSTSGWGVDNQNFTAGELMRFDFADVDDFDGAGPYVPPTFSGPNVVEATFSFLGYDADTIHYVVHYTDNSTSSGQFLVAQNATVTQTIPVGGNTKIIDFIELYTADGSGNGKVDLVNLGVTNVGDPQDLGFNVTVTDADGDQDQASLTLDLRNPDPVLVVGTNVSDAGVSTTDHFIANPNLADVDGNIAGSAGADVLVGDLGGVASGSYNLTFIIDTSGSINNTELGQMKTALKTLLDKFVGVTDLQIEIGTFATNSQIVGSYSTVSDAKAAIDALSRTPGGSNTNYQAALTMANTLVANDTAADNKIVLFVTDGDPTTGNWISTTEILAGMNGLSHLSDSATAVNNIQINAIGIGLGDTSGFDTSATRLNAIDNTTDGYVPIANFSDLTNGLGSIFVPVAVGNDALVGGNGSDILFGDSIHADGSDGGWAKLVADNPGLSNAQLRTLVANNHSLFGQDGSQGGNDSLDGGAGNDILYGQKGNDILTGGTGDDLLIGGSGRDTFKWQVGDADGGIDRITDFAKGSGGDILDISAVLDVSTGAHADTLATYLNFTFDSANNRTVLTIDSNGTTGGSQVNQTVYFDGVDLTGGSTDQQAIINSLLANLKVDD
ncbi:retention module-containing protein [Aeromonas veronii]